MFGRFKAGASDDDMSAAGGRLKQQLALAGSTAKGNVWVTDRLWQRPSRHDASGLTWASA